MPERTNAVKVRIEPWEDSDLTLLRQLNAPEMMEHLGGPETEEQILARHKRYVEIDRSGTDCMFSIVLSPFQGRGIAAAAVEATIASAMAAKKYRYIHAFPSADNQASNAICQKLHFSFEECNFEDPPGSVMRCNDWRFDFASTT